jgi:DnaJ-class molecular chaperone
MRCGDPCEDSWDDCLCDACKKHIQRRLIHNGEVCERCDGHGRVYGTWCDIQRAMNGRDTVCPSCGGAGREEWTPKLNDVHPDLRAEVKARV